MQKLLLSCEIEYDEVTHNIKANVENRGCQHLFPVAIANLIQAKGKSVKAKNPVGYYAAIVLQVIDHLAVMDHVDMTTIDMAALTKMGGGQDG